MITNYIYLKIKLDTIYLEELMVEFLRTYKSVKVEIKDDCYLLTLEEEREG